MAGKSYKILAATLLLAQACVKDKPVDPVAPVTIGKDGSVYVICEGSYGSGNGGLTLFSTKAGTVIEDVYKMANNQSVGDVFQSMQLIDERFFLCVNNSDKVAVINKTDHKLLGTINVPKPRYIMPINPEKAYVSSLYSNKLYIINPKTMSLTGSITLPYQNSEGLLSYNGNAYVCCWDTACSKLLKINSVTDNILQEITVSGSAPQEVLLDKNEHIWVLSGNVQKGKSCALTCIDPQNDKTIKSFSFPAQADAIRPVFNPAGNMLYFIEVNYTGGITNNGIYRMDIDEVSLPSKAFIQAQSYQYFWALGISQASGRIYVGDPKGFTQKGAVYMYDSSGSKVNQFGTSIGPGHFYFDE